MGMDRFSLSGKVGIVTGGGRGLGKEIALGLAEAGGDIVVVSRHLDEVERVRAQVEKMGRKGLALEVDVSKKNDINMMVDKCMEKFGRVDILVNNAGIVIRNAIVNVEEEDFDRLMNINLKGAFFCAQRVAKEMIPKGRGRIINIASAGGEIAFPETAIYRASKAALIHLTKTMALEWVQYGINVNAIGPGYFSTPASKYIKEKRKEEYEYLTNRIPMKRFGDPEKEIAGVAVFLASDASTYLTGQTIFVDGGLLIKQ